MMDMANANEFEEMTSWMVEKVSTSTPTSYRYGLVIENGNKEG